MEEFEKMAAIELDEPEIAGEAGSEQELQPELNEDMSVEDEVGVVEQSSNDQEAGANTEAEPAEPHTTA